MLCDRCREREATVHARAVTDTGTLLRTSALCEVCARTPRRVPRRHAPGGGAGIRRPASSGSGRMNECLLFVHAGARLAGADPAHTWPA